MDAAEYKHLGLGLIFLKSLSDTLQAKRAVPSDDYFLTDSNLASLLRRQGLCRSPQSQLDASETLSEPSREWLRLALHLARLTDPTKARLELLRAGIAGYDYDMPSGRSVVG